MCVQACDFVLSCMDVHAEVFAHARACARMKTYVFVNATLRTHVRSRTVMYASMLGCVRELCLRVFVFHVSMNVHRVHMKVFVFACRQQLQSNVHLILFLPSRSGSLLPFSRRTRRWWSA